ncbi:MAG TPA: prepilin-type N-terminal cleavage/methylation domain-containing protein [Candidatus Paceibacterota bacterium]|nr:prepilin-type N-terminal cleavage/methylation domain-containing protein [Candidatus Paceibacterota bacterium]
MKKTTVQFNKSHNGFTLMEVMVSVSIFAIIITIGIGSLLTIYSTLQKTRADQQTMDSLSYVMDTMTRRVRTGTEYSSPDGQSIRFRDQIDETTGGNMITYGIRPDLTTGEMRLYVEEADGEYDITPENMRIDAFAVNLTGGINGADGGQSLVEFQVQATIKNGKQETPLAIQTAVSQRPFEGGGTTPASSGNVKPDGGSSFGGGTGITPPRIETPGADNVNTPTNQGGTNPPTAANTTGTATSIKTRGE